MTETPLICELNLVVVPDDELASRHIALSRQLATTYRSIMTLTSIEPRLAFAPHMTVFEAALQTRDLDTLGAGFAALAKKTSALTLTASEYAFHADDANVEIRYDLTPELLALQADMVALVNPLRGDLLMEMDGGGHLFSERIKESGAAGDSIRRTGFDAVGDPDEGGAFHPHVSINWFEPGTQVDLASSELPAISEFDGRFEAVAAYALGPYGTCAQRLAASAFSV